MTDPTNALIAAEALPNGYHTVAERFWRPLARFIAERTRVRKPLLVGINGAQGSGKSTLCRFLNLYLAQDGLTAATLSLDDLYLPKADRAALARDVHPLFATRGVPGTHDVALGMRLLDDLLAGRAADLPRFDKARDDRSPDSKHVTGPVNVVLFEGWCVGAAPQPAGALIRPVNMLEATEDPDGTWRREVNRRLASGYAALFSRIDVLVMLQVTGFESVRAHRLLQEQKLAQSHPDAAGVMDAAGIERFVAHYERLTRWMLEEMPGRAQIVFALHGQTPAALPAPLSA